MLKQIGFIYKIFIKGHLADPGLTADLLHADPFDSMLEKQRSACFEELRSFLGIYSAHAEMSYLIRKILTKIY